MSREIKRVTLDFEWPLGTVWKGYLNDRINLSYQCSACNGTGSSSTAQHLHDRWYGNSLFSPADNDSTALTPDDPSVWAFAKRNVDHAPDFYDIGEAAIRREALRLCHLWNGQWSRHLNAADVKALIKAGRLQDLTHGWAQKTGWVPKEPMPEITPAMVNTWAIGSWGHDGINAWVCITAACDRQGKSIKCETCEGEGKFWPSQALKAAEEAWERTEPPVGEAYQLWSMVSEGSPISPPCATPELLACWLAEHRKADGNTVAEWLAFIGVGWAPSAIVFHTSSSETAVLDGVKATALFD